MTTELYPNDYFGDLSTYNYEEARKTELKWLINEIIRPELPNIIDNIEKCVDMLNSDKVFKMPISNGANITRQSEGANVSISDGPSIRGIVTRQGPFILDFQAVVRFPEFQKGKQVLYRMNTGIKFPLLQLNNINSNLTDILETLENLEIQDDINIFIERFGYVLKLITQSISILQNPPKELNFPFSNNFAMKQMFQNCDELCESNHHEISLELVLFKNELCVEFRNLSKIINKPWCNIDPKTGKSTVDKIKEDLRSDRSKSLTDILKTYNVQIEEPSLINNIMMSTFSRDSTTLQQAQNLIARCVTFNNKVVSEVGKLTVATSDPSLISISSKLNALEHTISNHFTNLEVS